MLHRHNNYYLYEVKSSTSVKNKRGENHINDVCFQKYVLKECPSSTINSKKFTDLTVQAIIEKANKIVTNDLKISLRKYL